ncbi:SRPBCC domain-containing protein [Nocardia sp. SYP-A9097]|uniref:SRPBCC domain-containing protein n=1 Tax=Nocardia sp. SYP-A9097 TaxID=2663237 RepID=UPI00129B09C7|nr:SRPBCC domain-containing protein [Nocardia sp. SYP-A9097]MRH88593.1 SRPBCC domain-containing protein [Nocardia sp. SYP-A9097]
MNRLDTEIAIPAPRERVWSVLTDFAAYPQWSPTIRSIDGDLTVGARLNVRIVGPGGRAVPAHPTVVALEPGHLLRWDAVLFHPRLLSGLHEFRLVDDESGGTRVIQSDTYTGLLATPLRRLLTANEPLMRQQNMTLRERVAATVRTAD